MLGWCAHAAGISAFSPESVPGATDLAKPETWNSVLPKEWKLRMRAVEYSSITELQKGDIVAWISPGNAHCGFIASDALAVAQSNGRIGDNDGSQCKKNLTAGRGPRLESLQMIVNHPDWKMGKPVALRLVPDAGFTAELNWRDANDLDLHVVEPGGAHVYWNAPTGKDSALDVDDRDGFGPEHYVTHSVEDGSYRILMGYYEGSGSSTGTITISAGSQTKAFQYTIGAPNEDSVYPVAVVKVSTDPQTHEHKFEILSAEESRSVALYGHARKHR